MFIALLFLVVHLAGLREYTSVLNGTVGSVGLGWGMSAMLGATYILAYLAFVLLVPTFIIAAVISAILQRLFCSKPSANEPGTNTSPQN